MEADKVSCCSCFCLWLRRRENRNLRQLHPNANEVAKDSSQIEVFGLQSGRDLTMHAKPADLPSEAVDLSKHCDELLTKPTAVPLPVMCDVGTETEKKSLDSIQPKLELAPLNPSGHSVISTKATDCFVFAMRDLSPIPQNSSRHEIPDGRSFSTISEPAFRTQDPLINSFEMDQMEHFYNQSSERASLVAIKEKLDQAFDMQPKDSLDQAFDIQPKDRLNLATDTKPDDSLAFDKPKDRHILVSDKSKGYIEKPIDNKPKDSLALETTPKDNLDLKFMQLPLDPYEFENMPGLPELPDFKSTPDPFLQLYTLANPHQVQGRLRLKPITPDQNAKRRRLPTHNSKANVLDQLRKELNEQNKLEEGSPAP